MSPEARERGYLPTGFPRVSGDEPVILMSVILAKAFSPRERG